MKTVYIAGPMKGISLYNFPAFDAAEADLVAKGYIVFSPAAMDRKTGFDPTRDKMDPHHLLGAIRRDLSAVVDCDITAMLPGWEASTGAKAERSVALWAGRKVVDYPSMQEQKHVSVAPIQDAKHYIPQDDATRKNAPMARGCLFYFPAALFAVAQHSMESDKKHNPGNVDGPHWARTKSSDHADCIVRHLIDAGAPGEKDRKYHLRALAWRALAMLQEECEAEGAKPGVSSR